MVRIGNVVVLALTPDMPPVIALVMTVWPASKKPRPCVHDVALDRVKCFRGILLNQNPTEPRQLQPTDHMWRYVPAQVMAVLDVEDSSMEKGSVLLSQQSLDAVEKLRAPEELLGDGLANGGQVVAKKRKASSQLTNLKTVHRRLYKTATATVKPKKDCHTEATEDTW